MKQKKEVTRDSPTKLIIFYSVGSEKICPQVIHLISTSSAIEIKSIIVRMNKN